MLIPEVNGDGVNGARDPPTLLGAVNLVVDDWFMEAVGLNTSSLPIDGDVIVGKEEHNGDLE